MYLIKVPINFNTTSFIKENLEDKVYSEQTSIGMHIFMTPNLRYLRGTFKQEGPEGPGTLT